MIYWVILIFIDMKTKHIDAKIIREILGKDKFLMLNLDMIKKLGLNETLLLTYLLDKFEYFVHKDENILNTGMVFYRIDIEETVGLSSHLQRKAEMKLRTLEILSVEMKFENKLTYNIYKINLEKLIEVIYNTPSIF